MIRRTILLCVLCTHILVQQPLLAARVWGEQIKLLMTIFKTSQLHHGYGVASQWVKILIYTQHSHSHTSIHTIILITSHQQTSIFGHSEL